MVGIASLWLPVLASTLLVFLASCVVHMLLPHHRGDFAKLPDEEKVLEALRTAGLPPGNYAFPRPADMKDMASPEMQEKYARGPVGMVNVLPSGPPAMGKSLAQWFVFCLVMGILVAYVTGRTNAADADYLQVFRVSGAVAFIGYAGAQPLDSIWKGQAWSTTVKHVLDALLYSVLTAGCFGWLWPN